MIQTIQRFNLRETDGRYCLTFDDVEIPSVDAKLLEGQFELSDGSFLVIMTEDCPYEESMTVILFGFDLKQQDRLVFGAAYTSFVIKQCLVHGESEVRIHTDQAELALRVLAAPKKFTESLATKLAGTTAGENKRLWLTAVEEA